jgi:hypothetical protein
LYARTAKKPQAGVKKLLYIGIIQHFLIKMGFFFDESYSDNISYDYKLTTYKCLKCNRNIKEAILKYRKEPGND